MGKSEVIPLITTYSEVATIYIWYATYYYYFKL